MNILIVDDHETNRKLLRVTLQARGYHTIEANDGIEALEVLRSRQVDAIISDILMPRMDGYRLCHEVRSSEQFKNIPFIIYTSTFTAKSDEKLAIEFGADRFIKKPAPLKEVIESLEQVYAQARRVHAEPTERASEVMALQGYSEVLVRKLERRNSELVLAKEQLLLSNKELLKQTDELVVAKDALEMTAKQLKSLFDNLDDGFFSFDIARKTVIQFSPACEKVLGLSMETVLRNPMLWMDAIVPADRELFRGAEADLRAGKTLVHECRIQKPDGKTYWIQSKIKPSLDENGDLIRLDGLVSDINERKRLEQQLSHAQKVEAVGRLAGGIAHDFNNLLTAIIGYAELVLVKMESGSRLRQDVDEIRKAGERAAGLTRQLLAFSRKQILEPKIVDLNVIVSNTERMLRRLIGENVELVTNMAQDLEFVKIDPGQLEQVIVNLAVNARDAMPNGGKLTIETANVNVDESSIAHTALRPGRYVKLALRDTGCGISPEVQAQIFEPFFTTKGLGEGTGLGLSTVYGIIEQSGGCIQLRSAENRGTTFDIFLPQAERRPESVAPIRTVKETDLGGETILLTEDEASVRKLARVVLEAKGYKILEASDGEQALQLSSLHSGTIHLLLTDTVMPGMNGPVLHQRLSDIRPETKVLFMSGYTDDVVVLNAQLEAGIAFMQKPFRPEDLVRKVREVLDSQVSVFSRVQSGRGQSSAQ